jgi:hypothetical protein
MRKNTFEPVFRCTIFAVIALFGGRTFTESKTATFLNPVTVRRRAVSLK